MAALDDQLQKAVKLVLAHRVAQGDGAAAVVEKVDGTHHGAVAGDLADLRDGLVEGVLVHLAQDLFAKVCGYRLHLAADGGVVTGQVGVAALGVADAKRKAVGGQVKGHLVHNGRRRVPKVDGDGAAHRAGGLIHQAGGLAEEHILGVLADLGDLHLAEFFHVAAVVLAAEDSAHADLESRRAGQAGSAQHVAGGVSVEAPHPAAGLNDAGRHAADQRSGMLGLVRLGCQHGKVHRVHLVKAVGFQTYHLVVRGRHDGDDVQVDRRRHHHAVVVVGVVAANLGAAGRRVETHLAPLAKIALKMLNGAGIAVALCRDNVVVFRIQFAECCVVPACSNILLQSGRGCHNPSPFFAEKTLC